MNTQEIHVFPNQNKKIVVGINTSSLSPLKLTITLSEYEKPAINSDKVIVVEQEDLPSVEDAEYYYHTINNGLRMCGISVISSLWIFYANRIPRKLADKLAKDFL